MTDNQKNASGRSKGRHLGSLEGVTPETVLEILRVLHNKYPQTTETERE